MLGQSLLEAHHQTNYKFNDTVLNIDKRSSKAASLFSHLRQLVDYLLPLGIH